eukprot:TRINITY_DN3560_c0_g1_i1.p1 TRINITY_DN3560_c0_g1~~TRINITY_DN3560_c0_g1_i1.p1  ORF type:complete len:297 (-),score=26.27 TRINITY_DN3560_c0_g1_i1:51-941(-)
MKEPDTLRNDETELKETEKKWSKTTPAVLIIVALLLFFFPTKEYFVLTLQWLEELGPRLGAFAFVLIYVFTTVLLLPGVILTIFAGYLYGAWQGTLLSLVGSTTGAIACFFLGRKVFKKTVQSWASKYLILSAINSVLENHDGFKMVLLLRLSPITPYSVLNYLLSTSRIKFWSYALSTILGLIPGTFMYSYLGTAARSMTDVLNKSSLNDSSRTIRTWIFCFSLVLTVFVVILLGLVSNRAIKNALRLSASKDDLTQFDVIEQEAENLVSCTCNDNPTLSSSSELSADSGEENSD